MASPSKKNRVESKQDHIMRTHRETLKYCRRFDDRSERRGSGGRRAAREPVSDFVPERHTFRPDPPQWDPPKTEPARPAAPPTPPVVPAPTAAPSTTVTIDDLVVDLGKHTVEVAGKPVHLTGKEHGMLELLAQHNGTLVTKRMFMRHLYPDGEEPEEKVLDVFLTKMRKKLSNASDGKQYIETVRGRGYKLRDPRELDQGLE